MNKKLIAIAFIGVLTGRHVYADSHAPALDRFITSFSNDKQICDDINSILNDPVNKDFTTYVAKAKTDLPYSGTDFLIPERFSKKYIRPEWIDVPKEEIDKTELNTDTLDYIKTRLQKTEYYDLKVIKQSSKRILHFDDAHQNVAPIFDFDNETEETGRQPIYKYSYSGIAAIQKFPVGFPLCKVPGEHEYIYNRYYSFGCSFLNVNNTPDGNLALYLYVNPKTEEQSIRVIWPHSTYKHNDWDNHLELDIKRECEFVEKPSIH